MELADLVRIGDGVVERYAASGGNDQRVERAESLASGSPADGGSPGRRAGELRGWVSAGMGGATASWGAADSRHRRLLRTGVGRQEEELRSHRRQIDVGRGAGSPFRVCPDI